MKPREWWIETEEGVALDVFTSPIGESENQIHVIEKSAYDELKALLKDHENDWKRIQDAERKCDELKEALLEIHTKLIPKIPRMDGRASWTIQQRFIDYVVSSVLKGHE